MSKGERVRFGLFARGAVVTTLALVAGVLPGIPAVLGGAGAASAATLVPFSYTGAAQSWQVPAGVTSIQADLQGAQGGGTYGGLGGHLVATVSVTPGQILQINVGGRGGGATGGFNGGGGKGWNGAGISGGGASDVRVGAYGLTDRTLVGGGGGGQSPDATSIWGMGGAGGGTNGELGSDGSNGCWTGGGGGTQSAGGAAGNSGNPGAGGLGVGGDAGYSSGAGGGGYYGGGAGGSDVHCGSNAGGGGGSSYATLSATGVTSTSGARLGDGVVTITYPPPTPPGPPAPNAQTFAYNGTLQTWTVPGGVTQILVDAQGAAGAGGYGGRGGRVIAKVAVTAGQTLGVLVGGQGSGCCGFNGAGDWGWNSGGVPGGGASDVRVGGYLLSDRSVVAAGGGGSSPNADISYGHGGAGGGTQGAPGGNGSGCWTGGGGGTQAGGGAAGNSGGPGAGVLGAGGGAGYNGGAGGGGYYGGGGGGSDVHCGSNAGGGGGSSYPAPSSSAVNVADCNSGAGTVTISWPAPAVLPSPTPCGGTPIQAELMMAGGYNAAERGVACSAPRRNFVKPVESLSGNFWHTFDDLSIPGRGRALQFSHTYNSMSAASNGPLGYGWTFPYNITLTNPDGTPISGTPNAIVAHQENGATVTFTLTSGLYTAPPRVSATLVNNGSGYTFTRNARDILTFDSSGNLTSERDLNGYTTTVGARGATQTITDPASRTLTLTFTGSLLTKVADTASPVRQVLFAYNDGAGNLTDVTDVAGGNSHFTYDASHRMLTMRGPRGNTTTNHFDSLGRVDWQKDELNRQTSFDYTSISGATKITDPKGNVTLQRFDANGLMTSETDGYLSGKDATTSFTYDPVTLGCATTTDPNGHTETKTWDSHGNVLSDTDVLNRTTSATYDSLNDRLTETDPKNITTTMTYDGAGNVQTRSTPLDNPAGTQTTTYTYGGPYAGDVMSMTDPNTKLWNYSYDSYGDLASATDPLGNKTTYGYDTVGRRTSQVSPKGNVTGCGCASTYTTTYTTNAFGDLTAQVDPLSHVTTRAYDGDRNLTGTMDGDGNTTQNTYDAASELTAENRADASTITYGYDAAGNQTSVTQPAPPVAADNFNHGTTALGAAQSGQPWQVINGAPATNGTQFWPSTVASAWAYLDAGRADGVVRATTTLSTTAASSFPFLILRAVNSNTWLYVYVDSSGNTVSLDKDAGGSYSQLSSVPFTFTAGKTYNLAATMTGASIAVSVNSNPVLSYTLSGADQTTYGSATRHGVGINVANTAQQQVRWDDFSVSPLTTTTSTYDPLNRLATSADQLGRTTTYGYDGASNRTSLKDPANRTTTYGYDAANELTSTTYSDGVTPNVSAITYDPDGQRTAMTDGTGTSTWTWDSLHRMTQSNNGAGQTVGYGYDLKGQLTSIAYPGTGHTATRTYYDNGQLHTVADWLSHTTTFAYDPDSNLQTETYPNTTTATQGFDAADRLSSIAHAKSGTNFLSLAYTRDGADQLTQTVTTPGSTENYGYTALQQLKSVNNATFTYDGADNLTQNGYPPAASMTHDTANETTKATVLGGGTAYGYDTQGNRTSAGPAVGQPMTYGYDQANRLVSAASAGSRGQASGGWYHSLVVRPDGTVAASGLNTYGELGNNSTTNSLTPVTVSGLSGVTQVSGGAYHSVALLNNGVIEDWGLNSVGELGDGTTTDRHTPVLSGLRGVSAAAGYAHTAAVTTDGTVWAWGYNATGAIGDGTTTNRLTATQIPGLSGFTQITAGYNFTVALRGDGTVWAWGYNLYGELGDGTSTQRNSPVQVSGLTGVVAISANANSAHVLALKSDGTVWAWGSNAYGQLGNNSTTDAHTPVQVPGLTGVVSVTAGGSFSLAAKSDGTVWAWGYNHYGELGNNSTTDSHVPVQVTGLSGVAALGAGPFQSIAEKPDGTTWDWGGSPDGELGNGGTANVLVPTQVAAFSSALPAKTTTYRYDGDGLRASKTVNGTPEAFSWDQAEGMPQLLMDGTTNYITGPGGLPIERIDGSGVVTYFHDDQLGSTRALTDGSGNTVGTFAYDAYGNLTAKTGTVTDPFGYAGQYADAETGFQYLRARYYDPATAQWISRDPAVAQTGAAYNYANNDPLNGVDPSGLGVNLPGGFCIKAGPGDDSCHTAVDQFKKDHPGAAQHIVDASGGALSANPITALLPLDLKGHGVNECSGWYQGGAAAQVAVDLYAASDLLPFSEGPPEGPRPPGFDDSWQWREGPRASAGNHWWDPNGGEWRLHEPDPWHDTTHWDYNPWDQWNNPWQTRAL